MYAPFLLSLALGSPLAGVDPPAFSKVPAALQPVAAELRDVYGMRSCGSALNENLVWLFPPALVDLDAKEATIENEFLCGIWSRVNGLLEPEGEGCTGNGPSSVSPNRDIAGCAYQRIAALRSALGDLPPDSPSDFGSTTDLLREQSDLLSDLDAQLAMLVTGPSDGKDSDRGALQAAEAFIARYQRVTEHILDHARARCRLDQGTDNEVILAEAYDALSKVADSAAKKFDCIVDAVGRRHVLTLTGSKNMMELGSEHNGRHAASLCQQPLYCTSVLSRAYLENTDVRAQNGEVHDNSLEPMVVYRAQMNSVDFLEASVSLNRRSVCGANSQDGLSGQTKAALTMNVFYHYWRALMDVGDPILHPSCIVSSADLAQLLSDAGQFKRFFSLGPWEQKYLTHVEAVLAAQCLSGPRLANLQSRFDATTVEQMTLFLQRLYQSMTTRALERLQVVELLPWEQRGKRCDSAPEKIWYGQTRSIYPQYVNPACDAVEPVDYEALVRQLRSLGSNRYAPLQESWWYAARPVSEGVAVRLKFGEAMSRALKEMDAE